MNPFAAAALAAVLGLPPSLARSAPDAPAVPAAAMAPAPHAVPDTLAQRLQACTACHGKEGVTVNEAYFPRIAGKPAGYLYEQLLNLRDGRRQNAAMASLLATLSDGYLREIAAHFAALELPYPAPRPAAATAGTLARGERLVRQGDAARGIPTCVDCHGARMTGREPAMPGLLGLPRDYLVAQIGAWKTGARRSVAPDCMATIAGRLSTDDLDALSAWLASQPLPADPKPVAASGAALPLPCGVPR